VPDIGLFELLLIGVLLFVVVGPERMPEFFGQIGGWVRSGRNWMNQIRGQISNETADITAPIRDAKAQVEQSLDQLGATAREVGDTLQASPPPSADAQDDSSGKH